MKFFEMINNIDINETASSIQYFYGMDEDIDSYKEVISKLKGMERSPEVETMRIVISSEFEDNEADGYEGEPFVDVHGIDPTSELDENTGRSGEDIAWGIGFIPWNKLLNMEVEIKNSAEGFIVDLEDAVAHILYEITFYGFDEESIQSVLNEIKERVEEVKGILK